MNVGASATISAGQLYGLAAIKDTESNVGNTSITTDTGDTNNSGGLGIQANNSANPSTNTSSSQISITTLSGTTIGTISTINSGFDMSTNGNQPGGIWAGYNPGGQAVVNSNVHGNVVIDNYANINAASGVGIGLYNFGVGNLSATIEASSTISAASAGVNAFAQGGGNVSIVNHGAIVANGGTGITVGTGTGTPNSVGGFISVNNSGAITSLGSSPNPVVQINNASTQAAILTNSGNITANLFGKATSSVAVADFNGSIVINNTGTISGNVSLSSSTFNNLAGGTWRVSGANFLGSSSSIANAGTIAISGQSSLNAVGIFALSNAGTINIQPNSTAFINANVSGGGTFTIGDHSLLELAGSVALGQTVSFAAGGRGMLTLDNPLGFQGTISRLATGDVLNLFGGINISGASTDGSTLTISGSTPLTYQVTGVAAGPPFHLPSPAKILSC